jgi:hypothetical protein
VQPDSSPLYCGELSGRALNLASSVRFAPLLACFENPNHAILTPMVTLYLIPDDIAADYEVHEWRNATGVLQTAHLTEWEDIVEALRDFRFKRSELLKGGGGKSLIAQRIDSFLTGRGWKEKKFATKIRVDDEEWDSPTHKVDCFKGRVGLEIEWNNKDPFYDRDLNNFRLLFDLRVIEVGVIVTRATNLQLIFKSLGTKVGNNMVRPPRTWTSSYRA